MEKTLNFNVQAVFLRLIKHGCLVICLDVAETETGIRAATKTEGQY